MYKISGNSQPLIPALQHTSSVLTAGGDLGPEHPLVDYTPPQTITLLYTDLGVLPTSGVTERLIKLYT